MTLIPLGLPHEVGKEQQGRGGINGGPLGEKFPGRQEDERINAEQQGVLQKRQGKNVDPQSGEKDMLNPSIQRRLGAVAPTPILRDQHLLGFIQLEAARNDRPREHLQAEINPDENEKPADHPGIRARRGRDGCGRDLISGGAAASVNGGPFNFQIGSFAFYFNRRRREWRKCRRQWCPDFVTYASA